MNARRLVAALAVATALAGCTDPDATASRSATTTAPRATTTVADGTRVPGDDWTVDTPASQGMDPTALEKARSYAFADGKNTQGVVIVRHGVIVDEWYAPGANKDSWAASWSMAKSVASALVGIAIGEGKIPSIDVKMTTYYPDWAQRGLGDVTLRDVLEMSSGLKWDESYAPEDLGTSDVIDMVTRESDELAYAASRPRAVPPGTVFNYTSGGSMLLSGVLQQATGMSARDYASAKLWSQIGVTKVDMWNDAAGHTLTYCCVDTSSRNFARFGLLYLHQGAWGGKQVVPTSWVADSVAGSRAAHDTYGLQWWLDDAQGVPSDMFYADGHDGQFIYVIPSLDLVVVRNGTYVKNPGPPVADPTLFNLYPSGGLAPGAGTTPPDNWDNGAFLTPIVDSIRK
ncbi:MAG: serine hydrolase [Acidimicrobiales bacterium]